MNFKKKKSKQLSLNLSFESSCFQAPISLAFSFQNKYFVLSKKGRGGR